MADTKVDETFMGFSNTDCGVYCDDEKCVITENNICGHPMKGALQPAMQSDAGIKKRRNLAKISIIRGNADQAAIATAKAGLS
jgi:hypothetical protein